MQKRARMSESDLKGAVSRQLIEANSLYGSQDGDDAHRDKAQRFFNGNMEEAIAGLKNFSFDDSELASVGLDLGLRQEINLTILAVATILTIFSVLLLTAVELLRRRNERLTGTSRVEQGVSV